MAARAVFYFRLRYPDAISAVELPPDPFSVLLGWHEHDPVSLWQRHRNAAIYARQGTRNPFIVHPEWAGEALSQFHASERQGPFVVWWLASAGNDANQMGAVMAQRTVTTLVDDLDGKEIPQGEGETVKFELDKDSYEIDLSKDNAAPLREP